MSDISDTSCDLLEFTFPFQHRLTDYLGTHAPEKVFPLLNVASGNIIFDIGKKH